MIKLTRDEMQAVVDYLQVQHDSLFEIIVDKASTEEDREECRKDEKALRKFFLAAQEKGLDISKSLYPLEMKIKHIEED
jgi:hypothetical protein